MKTLRLIGMVVVAIVISMSLTACDDDDEDDGNSSNSSTLVTVNGHTLDTKFYGIWKYEETSNDGKVYAHYFRFDSDCMFYDWETIDDVYVEDSYMYDEWYVSDGWLYLDELKTFQYDFQGDTLVWYIPSDNGGYSVYAVLVKV